MDADERFEMNEQSRMEENLPRITCSACPNELTPAEILDPIIVDGEYFCDKCMSNKTYIEMLRPVNDITKVYRRYECPYCDYKMTPQQAITCECPACAHHILWPLWLPQFRIQEMVALSQID